ncbi:putative Ig domain-containing protein, partial [Streptomyces galilaeus]
ASFTVTATDGTTSFTNSRAFSLTIADAPAFTTAATLGYRQTNSAVAGLSIVATGTGTISYALSSGSLPAGLTLSGTGAITGTP